MDSRHQRNRIADYDDLSLPKKASGAPRQNKILKVKPDPSINSKQFRAQKLSKSQNPNSKAMNNKQKLAQTEQFRNLKNIEQDETQAVDSTIPQHLYMQLIQNLEK